MSGSIPSDFSENLLFFSLKMENFNLISEADVSFFPWQNVGAIWFWVRIKKVPVGWGEKLLNLCWMDFTVSTGLILPQNDQFENAAHVFFSSSKKSIQIFSYFLRFSSLR